MTCVTRRAGVVLAAKLPGDARVIYFRCGSQPEVSDGHENVGHTPGASGLRRPS